jgi:hypothetical protein
MTKLSLGTLGLCLAVRLYGMDCVLSCGDWTTPGVIEIPTEDVPTFNELLRELAQKNCISPTVAAYR